MASYQPYGAVRLAPAPAEVVRPAPQQGTEERQRSRNNLLALIASFTVLALLAGNHHGQAPARAGATMSSLQAKSHQQQLEAEVKAKQEPRKVALDDMDKHGGWGTKMVASIEDAINTPPDDENSHYFAGHTDRMTHLTLITFLILATITVACMWRENQTRQEAPAPQASMRR